jgi:Arc/MetJ-type ribon-helix-helix transcriptional regulator
VSEYYKLVTVKIPMELDQQVKEIMKAVGKVTMSEVVREALYEWVEKRRHLITSTTAATERETR